MYKLKYKNMEFTRKDYLNHTCTHEQYYSQFVNEYMKTVVLNTIDEDILIPAYKADTNLNNIPLITWDRLSYLVDDLYEIQEAGDTMSFAFATCVLKEAAREIANYVIERYKIVLI